MMGPEFDQIARRFDSIEDRMSAVEESVPILAEQIASLESAVKKIRFIVDALVESVETSLDVDIDHSIRIGRIEARR